jgi:hypothetical protein
MHQYSAIGTPIARTRRKKMARNTKPREPWNGRGAILMSVWHGEVDLFVVWQFVVVIGVLTKPRRKSHKVVTGSDTAKHLHDRIKILCNSD